MSLDGVAQAQVLRRGGNELLGPDTGGHLRERNIDVEATAQPGPDRLSQWIGPDARRVPALGVRRRQRRDHAVEGWIAGRADRQIDDSAVVCAARAASTIEPIVRIGRRNEACGLSHEPSILPDDSPSPPAIASGRRGDDELGQSAGRRIRRSCSHSNTVLVVMSRDAPRPRGVRLPGDRRGRTGSATRRSC